ncbi:hypothetical protein [Streptomyces sp. NBC_00687]|uniref:hypothetical protein n=1 Tax=Streptomyces sp. NBC_00687 TaxID=2975807 RepID=UPI0022503D30|nr:hypothetical protein [Streptomyces sp. NBC_00687]MCX4920231.1 hypothetical protein [Streptomyces sp. NBC_00687]
MYEVGEFSDRSLGPVLIEVGIVVLGEVVDRGIDKEGLWKVQTHSKATGIHSDFQDGPRGGGAMFKAAQQFWCTCEVLRYASVATRPSKGVGQESVAIPCKCGSRTQSSLVENFGDGECAVGKQFPYSAVEIRGAGTGQRCEPIRVLGPESAQDEHWPACVFCEQAVERGCDALAGLHGA